MTKVNHIAPSSRDGGTGCLVHPNILYLYFYLFIKIGHSSSLNAAAAAVPHKKPLLLVQVDKRSQGASCAPRCRWPFPSSQSPNTFPQPPTQTSTSQSPHPPTFQAHTSYSSYFLRIRNFWFNFSPHISASIATKQILRQNSVNVEKCLHITDILHIFHCSCEEICHVAKFIHISPYFST